MEWGDYLQGVKLHDYKTNNLDYQHNSVYKWEVVHIIFKLF